MPVIDDVMLALVELQQRRAAPPAPVSAPDFGELTKCIVQRLVDYGSADDAAIASAEEFVYNACRDAMLQGKAEPVTTLKPAIFIDGSISPDDVDKLAEAISKFNSERRGPQEMIAESVSQRDELPEGWVAVPVEPTPEMLAEICLVDGWTERALRARYKAMLAAVPQPEVK
ncbi:hypothetical protein OH721_03750 [Escherichia coli]|nr:hypothetical protein [Escherichia coli]